MWRLSSVCLIAVLSIGNGVNPSQAPQHSPKINAQVKPNGPVQDQQKAKQEDSPLPSTLQGGVPTISDHSDSAKCGEQCEKEGTEFWPPFAGYRFKITDSLLVLFTFILAIFTGLLWRSTKKLWKEAIKASGIAQQSANAATKAADAAERTVNTMKDIAERQLRAYVSVATAEIHDLAAGLTPRAHLVIRNSGQTPAYHLIGIYGMAMEVSWDALTPPSSDPIDVTATSLAAGAPTNQFISAPRPLKDGEREALIDGSKTLWVYGEMRYRDTFNVERITEYRFQVGGKAGLSGIRMAISPEGNRET